LSPSSILWSLRLWGSVFNIELPAAFLLWSWVLEDHFNPKYFLYPLLVEMRFSFSNLENSRFSEHSIFLLKFLFYICKYFKFAHNSYIGRYIVAFTYVFTKFNFFSVLLFLGTTLNDTGNEPVHPINNLPQNFCAQC
jgi:hypothetical protein